MTSKELVEQIEKLITPWSADNMNRVAITDEALWQLPQGTRAALFIFALVILQALARMKGNSLVHQATREVVAHLNHAIHVDAMPAMKQIVEMVLPKDMVN